MTDTDMMLVAAMAGGALIITAVDLILSLRRHRRLGVARSQNAAIEQSVQDGSTVTTSGVWAKHRLAAIQEASGKAIQ